MRKKLPALLVASLLTLTGCTVVPNPNYYDPDWRNRPVTYYDPYSATHGLTWNLQPPVYRYCCRTGWRTAEASHSATAAGQGFRSGATRKD